MKCKLCANTAEHEPGHFNFAAFFYPLCEDHMKEYKEFKENFMK